MHLFQYNQKQHLIVPIPILSAVTLINICLFQCHVFAFMNKMLFTVHINIIAGINCGSSISNQTIVHFDVQIYWNCNINCKKRAVI